MSIPQLSAALAATPKPKRRRSGSWLGRILGTLGVVFVLMLAIGFGVQQQADHQIIPPASHTQQH